MEKKINKTKKIADVNGGNTKPPFKQSRNWCFTDFELIDFEPIYNEYKDIIRYICWGKETCPKTQKLHHQGWIQFINKKTMGGVKRILKTKKIHLENCRGNEYDNTKYCKKDNNYKEFGKFICQGERTDLETIKKKIDEGASMKKIADDHFGDFIRYHKGFEKYKQLVERESYPKWRNIKVTLISGPTGCGKTKMAMKKAQYKIEGNSLNWWDGYEGQNTICIDEYNNDIPITKLLNLLDGYQLRLPIKGGFTYANWNKLYITTNLVKLHENAKEEHINALNRRITKHINLWDKKNELTL